MSAIARTASLIRPDRPLRCRVCGRSQSAVVSGIGGLYAGSATCYDVGPDGYPEPVGDHEFTEDGQ